MTAPPPGEHAPCQRAKVPGKRASHGYRLSLSGLEGAGPTRLRLFHRQSHVQEWSFGRKGSQDCTVISEQNFFSARLPGALVLPSSGKRASKHTVRLNIEVPAEEFSAVVDVNLNGVVNVIRHFVPAMIERGRGVIVNFSSGWGRSTDAEVAPYCATKWAIEGLAQALAQELPSGLAAIALNPGIINTEMLQSCFGASASAYPTPEQWAKKAVPFLLGLGPKHNGRPLTAP